MTLRLNASNLQMTNNSTYVRSHFGSEKPLLLDIFQSFLL